MKYEISTTGIAYLLSQRTKKHKFDKNFEFFLFNICNPQKFIQVVAYLAEWAYGFCTITLPFRLC